MGGEQINREEPEGKGAGVPETELRGLDEKGHTDSRREREDEAHSLVFKPTHTGHDQDGDRPQAGDDNEMSRREAFDDQKAKRDRQPDDGGHPANQRTVEDEGQDEGDNQEGGADEQPDGRFAFDESEAKAGGGGDESNAGERGRGNVESVLRRFGNGSSKRNDGRQRGDECEDHGDGDDV